MIKNGDTSFDMFDASLYIAHHIIHTPYEYEFREQNACNRSNYFTFDYRFDNN